MLKSEGHGLYRLALLKEVVTGVLCETEKTFQGEALICGASLHGGV